MRYKICRHIQSCSCPESNPGLPVLSQLIQCAVKYEQYTDSLNVHKTKCFLQRISEALHWGDTDGIIHDRANIEKDLSLQWGGTRGIAAKIRLRSSLKAVLINQLVNTQAALRSDASSSWTDLWTTAISVPSLLITQIVGQKPIFFLLALQPPLGVVFYSPLVGFSLLAYEVSWSHTTTRHIR